MGIDIAQELAYIHIAHVRGAREKNCFVKKST